ncbi:glycosyltransferase family 4 protein [Mycobacterium sp. C31M]
MGLKVLMIGVYPLEQGVVNGGVESATSTLVPALAQRDDIDSVTVLCFHHGDAPTPFRCESTKVEIHYVRAQNRLRMLTGALLDLRKARKLIAQVKPDVIHAQEINVDGDIATRCSPRCVVTVHGITYVECRLFGGPAAWKYLREKLIRHVAQRVLRRAKVVVSISRYDAEEVAGMVRGKLLSIPNATSWEFFASAPPAPTEPRLLCAGALTPRKNQLGLVDAFAQIVKILPGARLALVGPQPDADYARRVRERVTSLGVHDRVDMVGQVDNERMRHEIARARAVVLFSRQETAPTIIAQAMAAGKPVVASRVGGIAEMVDDGATGFVVESEDEAKLVDRLLTVLQDEDLSLRMGTRGHEVAKARYSPDRVAALTVDAYRTALSQEA